jgi:phenylacetate-CoA ligase
VVVTTLHNFATPLIRYDIGDYAAIGEPCTCGRGLPVLTRILGRVRNMLALPNDEPHYADLNSGKVHHLAPVLQQQVGLNEIELRLVVTRAPTRA